MQQSSCATGMPVVKNTFLTIEAEDTAIARRRRAQSHSPSGSCDAFARQFHMLFYKPTPVPDVLPAPHAAPLVRTTSVTCWADEPVSDDEGPFTPVTKTGWKTQKTTTSAPVRRTATACTAKKIHQEEAPKTPVKKVNTVAAEGGAVRVAGRKVAVPAAPTAACPEKNTGNAAGDDTSSASTTDAGEDSFNFTPSSSSSLYDELQEEELIRRIPRDDKGQLLTIGSIGHEEGTCKPCVFAHSEKRKCENGIHCPFCHFVHAPKVRVRMCKRKRDERKRQEELERQQVA